VAEASDGPPPAAARAAAGGIIDEDGWIDWVGGSTLRGPARVLAEHAGFIGSDAGVLRLSLSADDEMLKLPLLVDEISDACAPVFGSRPQLRFETADSPAQSLRQRTERARDERQAAAEEAFMGDPEVQRLINQHGARLVPDSIRPYDAA